MTMQLTLQHLGMSGLCLTLDEDSLCVDPPLPVADDPVLITWSEAERVSGVGGAGAVLADPDVLDWLGVSGVPLIPDRPARFGAFEVAVLPYRPIPYATPREALRKTFIGLRRPHVAARRLAHTLSRPAAPPLAVRLDWSGMRIGLCQQALHRFVTPAGADEVRAFFADCHVAIASPDFDDEEACGRMLGALGARRAVLIDSIGPVRRMLGLPTRALRASMATAPPGTLLLEDGQRVTLNLA